MEQPNLVDIKTLLPVRPMPLSWSEGSIEGRTIPPSENANNSHILGGTFFLVIALLDEIS